jgi:hypothetical protein
MPGSLSMPVVRALAPTRPNVLPSTICTASAPSSNGPAPKKLVDERATMRGFSEDQLKRAKSKMGVIAFKEKGKMEAPGFGACHNMNQSKRKEVDIMTDDENDRLMRYFFAHRAKEHELAKSQPDWTEGWNCTRTDESIDRETERLMQAYREVLYRRLGHDHQHLGPAIPGQPHCYKGIEGSYEAGEIARKQAEELRPLFYDMARSLVESEEKERDISLVENGKPQVFPAPTKRPSRRG